MKAKLIALTIPTLLAANTASAATVYDKDGTTLDLYGRATCITVLIMTRCVVIRATSVWV